MNKIEIFTQYFNTLKELNNVKEQYETRISYLKDNLESLEKAIKETYKIDISKIVEEGGNLYG